MTTHDQWKQRDEASEETERPVKPEQFATLDDLLADHQARCGARYVETYVRTGVGRGFYTYRCPECGSSYRTES